jgi:hypothetical protein
MRLVKILMAIIVGVSLFVPHSGLADPVTLNLDYPVFKIGDDTYDPSTEQGQDLNQLAAWTYYFIVVISGFSAFFSIVIAGFNWMTSRGNPTAIGEAKDRMTSAFLGLLIILAAYLILQALNPDLTILKEPPLPYVPPPPP